MNYGQPLYGATVKLASARERFDHLQSLITELTERVSNSSIALESDPNDGKDVIVFRFSQQPPVKWSVILGEIIHDFRSALDHAIYQLTIHHSKRPLERTEFPIFKDEAKYLKTTSDGGHFKIRGIPPAAIKAIDAIQPFETQKGNRQALDEVPLWCLQELSNIDKHRTLNLVSIRTDTVHVKVREETAAAPIPLDQIWTCPPGRVADRTILASWPTGMCKGQMHMDLKFAWQIAVDCPELPNISKLPLAEVIKSIGRAAEHVLLKILAPFF
jgi:hypothetical protein